jgi:hypothetical protein
MAEKHNENCRHEGIFLISHSLELAVVERKNNLLPGGTPAQRMGLKPDGA